MAVSNFIILILIGTIHLFLWVYGFKKILEEPRNWLAIMLIMIAYVVVNNILNNIIREMDIPLVVTILLMLFYFGLDGVVYYDHKKKKQLSERKEQG